MDVVDQWTGKHACALQAALRMTHEEFAEALGVGRRTVADWHAKPDTPLRAHLQRRLDREYERAPESAQVRFAHNLGQADTETPQGQAVALTVAIAAVRKRDDVLMVCRRPDESSGLTWQFPAGVVKPGMSPEVVAVRETLAETGVHCSVREHLGGRLHPTNGVRCEYFLCDYLAGEVANLDADENDSAIWVPRDDLTRFIPARLIFPPILEALEKEDLSERSA